MALSIKNFIAAFIHIHVRLQRTALYIQARPCTSKQFSRMILLIEDSTLLLIALKRGGEGFQTYCNQTSAARGTQLGSALADTSDNALYRIIRFDS